jgi:hypothetical protein
MVEVQGDLLLLHIVLVLEALVVVVEVEEVM